MTNARSLSALLLTLSLAGCFDSLDLGSCWGPTVSGPTGLQGEKRRAKLTGACLKSGCDRASPLALGDHDLALYVRSEADVRVESTDANVLAVELTNSDGACSDTDEPLVELALRGSGRGEGKASLRVLVNDKEVDRFDLEVVAPHALTFRPQANAVLHDTPIAGTIQATPGSTIFLDYALTDASGRELLASEALTVSVDNPEVALVREDGWNEPTAQERIEHDKPLEIVAQGPGETDVHAKLHGAETTIHIKVLGAASEDADAGRVDASDDGG